MYGRLTTLLLQSANNTETSFLPARHESTPTEEEEECGFDPSPSYVSRPV